LTIFIFQSDAASTQSAHDNCWKFVLVGFCHIARYINFLCRRGLKRVAVSIAQGYFAIHFMKEKLICYCCTQLFEPGHICELDVFTL